MARRILSLFLALVCLQIAAFAQTEFDVEAINKAANSVLMLAITRSGRTIATGSGYVAFNNRTLVTNCHVIEGGDAVLATSEDGYSFVLDKVIAVDEKADLAILGFASPTDRVPLNLNDGEILRAEPVVAIGSPKGMLNMVSMGNVSAISDYDGVSYVQFTASISSGSSGGPLFNDRGEVIGVTTAAYDDGRGIVQNLNFAVNACELVRLGAEMEERNAVGLEDYLYGARPGQTPVPTATLTPASTARPTPIPAPEVTPTPSNYMTLKKGMKNSQQVKNLQDRLFRLGWFNGVRDGDFGPATQTAVKEFQNALGLSKAEQGGIATPELQRRLFADDAPRGDGKTPEPTPEPEVTGSPTDQAVQRLADLGWMAQGATGQERTDAIFAFQQAAIDTGIFPDVMLNGTLDTATVECLLSPDAPSAP